MQLAAQVRHRNSLEESRQYCHVIDYCPNESRFDGVEPDIDSVDPVFLSMFHILASTIYWMAWPGKPDILGANSMIDMHYLYLKSFEISYSINLRYVKSKEFFKIESRIYLLICGVVTVLMRRIQSWITST
jgi:hypothetical protein